ncbi:MAG TPA: hypothetical protein VJ725_28470 [Thermoanaerobaculia bacterium]|nr:hypothetical protein [Thermoanaerobaculia bacterium]
MERWIVVMVLGQFAFVVLMLWIVLNYRLKRESHRAEERERLLNRFAAGPEMVDFLTSQAGQKLLDSLSTQKGVAVRSLAKTITAGTLLLCLGLAFLIVAGLDVLPEAAFEIPGVLTGMSGVGILVSAWISARLFRRSGLLRDGDGGPA